MGSYEPQPEIRSADDDDFVVLVTGTNSGLGSAICHRLIDEFLTSHPEKRSFTLIFTTRSSKKSNETLSHLRKHLDGCSSSSDSKSRISLKPEQVDLGDLVSVRALSRRLLSTVPKIDALVLNAGIAGFTGLNWFRAVYMILTDLVHAVTWPSSYTQSEAGVLAKKQTNLPDEPPLGQIFCANVFGHYMLSHNLVPLLSKSRNSPGRIVWTSSLEATSEMFNPDDIQALETPRAYESVKYLTDVLSLTTTLPSTAPYVNSFLCAPHIAKRKKSSKAQREQPETASTKPNIYVTHPGIIPTSIVPLIPPLAWAMIAVSWVARMLGSPWHLLSSYGGACSHIWVSLSPQPVLDAAESTYQRLGGSGKVKWGSSCDRLGREKVVCTEVEGCGFGGVIGGPVLEEDRQRRRKRGAKDLSAEERADFEETGRKCWREMEELRVQWDEILDRAEAETA